MNSITWKIPGDYMNNTHTIQLKDADIYPDDEILKTILGRAYAAYRALLDLFETNAMTHEWRYYRDGNAWLCKVQKKKRTIIWMSVWKGFVKATIYFPDRFMESVYSLAVSDATKENLKEAAAVGKSNTCVFTIRNKKILKDFEEVMQFKISAKLQGVM